MPKKRLRALVGGVGLAGGVGSVDSCCSRSRSATRSSSFFVFTVVIVLCYRRLEILLLLPPLPALPS